MIDNWRPSASLDVIKKRADLLRQIRAFFYARDVLEVDTPALSVAANTDPHIESFKTSYMGPSGNKELYLHTSPEFPMKRLLAAGSGAIYQLCKVFRDAELGRQHNPEFTMLEWYRTDFDHHNLMHEVADLIDDVLGEIDIPLRKISYQQAFNEHAGVDPTKSTVKELQTCVQQHALAPVVGLENDGVDAWLDLLMDQVVVPALGKGRVFIYDYPASQASLARISSENELFAERFELYIDGIEIANGFHELRNAKEQQNRFEADNKKRQAEGKSILPMDENLIAALNSGLPDCAGVAVGIDRLLMLKVAASSISDVLSFPIEKA